MKFKCSHNGDVLDEERRRRYLDRMIELKPVFGRVEDFDKRKGASRVRMGRRSPSLKGIGMTQLGRSTPEDTRYHELHSYVVLLSCKEKEGLTLTASIRSYSGIQKMAKGPWSVDGMCLRAFKKCDKKLMMFSGLLVLWWTLIWASRNRVDNIVLETSHSSRPRRMQSDLGNPLQTDQR